MSQVNENFMPIQQDGVHTWYYENDNSPNPVEGVYRKLVTNGGLLTGIFKQYRPDGKLEIKAQFEDGEFNGAYTEYFKNGNKKMSMIFENGIPITLIQTWYPSGNLRSRIPLNSTGQRVGWAEEFFDTDKNAIPSCRVKYHEGDKHGPAYKFNEYGRPLVKANYSQNKLNGDYERYYPNGVLMVKCTFVDGLLNGKYTANYNTGETKRILYFVNGKLSGRAFFYRPNKKIKTSCAFDLGQLNGDYHAFDTTGKLVVTKRYNHNQLIDSEYAQEV